MKRTLTVMTLLAGAASAYSQAAISLNNYVSSFGIIQVFQAQPLSNSPVQVTVNGYSGFEEMGQPANTYLSHPGSTVYTTKPSTIGTGYSVGLLALDSPGATNYAQLSFVSNSVSSLWSTNNAANSSNNPSVNNDFGMWTTGATATVPGSSSNASIAIAVWQNTGSSGAATTLAEAQADGYAWGVSSIVNAVLGVGLNPPTSLPTNLTSFSLVDATSMPAHLSGALWAMGDDSTGNLGDGTNSTLGVSTPEFVVANNVSAVAAGGYHSLFVKTDGSLWAMGDEQYGELGDGISGGSPATTNKPEQVVGSNVTAVAAGLYFSVFIKSDGSLWGMGDNSNGELTGTNSIETMPTLIATNGVASVAAGLYQTLWVTTNGTLWGVGRDYYGELGDGHSGLGNFTNQAEMIATGVSQVSSGNGSTLYVTTNGTLYAMGYNGYGELGDGNGGFTNTGAIFTNVPEMITNGVSAIASGGYHSLFIMTNGSLWAMGLNDYGQLGDGTTNNRYVPVMIEASNVVSIAAGDNHSLFIKSDGTLWAMGFDHYGQLGDHRSGGSTATNVPVQIATGVSGVSAGTAFSLYIGAPPSAQIAVSSGGTPITNGQSGAISFGSVTQNQPGPLLTFTINDTGGQVLNITNITVPSGFSLVSNPPSTIAIGNSGTFTVQLDTAAGGSFAGNITISNNDPNNNPFVFAVSGSVVSKVIALGGNMNFGVVPVNTSSNSTLTISNLGTTNLSVTNISFPAGFTAVWSNMTIAASNSQSITVTFSPTEVSNYSGNIVVSSDATSGSGTIAAVGFGTTTNQFLTVITNGSGTVAPILTAKELVTGHRYTLTATAKTGNVFSNWTGSVVTNKNPLTFTFAPGTILEANFVPNPFLPTKGTYNGLFSATNGQITEQTAGMLKGLVLGTRGTYSGTLLLNGSGHGLSGTFNLAGQATNKVTRPATQGGNLVVVLTLLNPSNAAPYITGTITASNWVSTNLIADLASNVPFSSEYTLTIPPATNSAASNAIPGGDGYAVLTNHTGTVKITGALADGTAFNESVPASQSGDVPVYANLYGSKGLLIGWINLNPTNAGTLNWVHPAERTGLFQSAFTTTNPIELSGWTNLASQPNMPTNLVMLTYTNGAVTQSNAFVIVVSNNFKLGEISGPTPLSGTLNPKTGQLSLSIGPAGHKVAATAVVLPEGTNGGGYFLTKTNSGAILLK